MTHTVDLPPDMEARLQAEAGRRQMPIDECLQTLVAHSLPEPAVPGDFQAQFKTGADVVAYWRREGIIGMWADREDMKDSVEYVNRLRHSIEEQSLAKQRVPSAPEG